MEAKTQPEPNVRKAVPFFAVSNMADSLRFYVDGLGFEIVERWVVEGAIRWCSLGLGEAEVMLQQFPTEGHDSWVPECKVGEGVSVCFICEDALAIYKEITARGLAASEPFVGNHMWVTKLSTRTGTSCTSRARPTFRKGHSCRS